MTNLYGEGQGLTEESPTRIVSFYGYIKAVAEQLICLSDKSDLIFRLSTVLGPCGHCFPNRLVWSVMHKSPVTLFDFGRVLRDIIDVRDVVTALTTYTHLRGTYNLGSNREIMGNDFVNVLEPHMVKHGMNFPLLRDELFHKVSWVPKGFVRKITLKTRIWNHAPRTLHETLRTLFAYYEKLDAKGPRVGELVKILCIILSLPSQLKFETIRSVMDQSVPVEMIILLTKKSMKPTLIERIADAENAGLEHISLKDFDYILKVDGDTILGRDFIKNNLTDKPDAVGAGFAFLVKVEPFMKLLGGRFYSECEDTYLGAKFLAAGRNVHSYYEEPIFVSKHYSLDVPYLVDRGKMLFRMGWMPLHVVQTIFYKMPYSLRNVFMVGSYFINLVLRPNKMDIANFVTWYQVRRETRPITRLFEK